MLSAVVPPLTPPKRSAPSATEETPVPPPPTPKSPASVLVKVRFCPEPVTVVEAVRPLKAVDEVAMTTAPVMVCAVGPIESTPVFVTFPAAYVRPVEKVVVAIPVHVPPENARTCPLVPAKSEVVASAVGTAEPDVLLARMEFAAMAERPAEPAE